MRYQCVRSGGKNSVHQLLKLRAHSRHWTAELPHVWQISAIYVCGQTSKIEVILVLWENGDVSVPGHDNYILWNVRRPCRSVADCCCNRPSPATLWGTSGQYQHLINSRVWKADKENNLWSCGSLTAGQRSVTEPECRGSGDRKWTDGLTDAHGATLEAPFSSPVRFSLKRLIQRLRIALNFQQMPRQHVCWMCSKPMWHSGALLVRPAIATSTTVLTRRQPTLKTHLLDNLMFFFLPFCC